MRSTALFLCLVSFLLAPAAGAINVYLDFDGHYEPQANNGHPIGLTGFVGSAADRAEIVQSLQEDFAPFVVAFYDLPTPPRPTRGWIRLVIGGDATAFGRNGKATWRCDQATAPWCDVAPDGNNVAWVAESASPGNRFSNRWIGTLAAHELGHALAKLAIQDQYATLATYLSHYIAGGSLGQSSHDLASLDKTQIMGGDRLGTFRDIWWTDSHVAKAYRIGHHPSDPNSWIYDYQDDLLTLASVLGLRRTDHGNTPARGTALTGVTVGLQPEESRVEGGGVVEMNSASWPGLCPPVPRWLSCPFIDSHGNEIPPGEDPGGQSGVLALSRDFFRFDLPSIGGSNFPQLLKVEVRTLNDRIPGRTIANLDADLEVWFNDPVGGWQEITSQGTRSDSPSDLWAEWILGFSTRGWYERGEYAVGVKSAGGYDDLGSYTVRVTGTRLVKVVPATTGGPHNGHGLSWSNGEGGPSVGEVAGQLPDLPELKQVMGAMATHGMSEDNLARLIEDPYSLEASDEALAVIEGALGQGGAARLLAQLIDWQKLDEGEAESVWNEVQDAMAHLESELLPPAESSEFETAWLDDQEFDGEDVACTTHVEAW